MKVAIPYKHQTGIELKYCLRGIEKYVAEPEVIVIGDKPEWLQNVTHIPFKNASDVKWKERNIFEKIGMVEGDFLFFNDDHFLLQPFENVYHFSGTLSERFKEYKPTNNFRIPIQNTIELYGDIPNYYRHSPILIKRELLKALNLDWNKPWGYCIKSIYCHLNKIDGSEYADLKIRDQLPADAIRNLIKGRPYFSTEENAMRSGGMIKVLDELYKFKSKYEV